MKWVEIKTSRLTNRIRLFNTAVRAKISNFCDAVTRDNMPHF